MQQGYEFSTNATNIPGCKQIFEQHFRAPGQLESFTQASAPKRDTPAGQAPGLKSGSEKECTKSVFYCISY